MTLDATHHARLEYLHDVLFPSLCVTILLLLPRVDLPSARGFFMEGPKGWVSH